MTDLTPSSSLDSVYQLETTDLALAGTSPSQTMNKQAQSLLNRTKFLDDKRIILEQFDTDLGSSSDIAKGASKVGRAIRQIVSIAELRTAGSQGRYAGDQIDLLGWHADLPGIGAGCFRWDAVSVEADNSISIIAVSGTVTGRWKLVFSFVLNSAQAGARPDGTDQTAAVQLALNALGANGGVVQIIKGTKFNLKTITFPVRSNLEYFIDSDSSAAGPGTELGTNELVSFAANSSGAIVNEWRQTAPFHPGFVLDVRADVAGQDAWLGGGQSRTDPVRVSYNVHQEQTDRFRWIFEKFADYNQFSGNSFHGWRPVITLNGIGTAQWVSVPVADVTITGTTSGAKGYVLSVGAGSTIVLWSSGKFVAGETVSDNNETTVATISSVGYTLTPMQPIGQDIKRGGWSCGLPMGAGGRVGQWAVGGRSTVAPTRDFSQYIEEAITHPVRSWVDNPEAVTVRGFDIVYDVTPAFESRRLTLRRFREAPNRGLIGSTTAKVSFSNSALIETSAYNISALARLSVGKYLVTINDDMTVADYAITIGNSNIADRSIWTNRAVGSFEIWNYNSADVLTDLTSEVSVLCSCGDI